MNAFGKKYKEHTFFRPSCFFSYCCHRGHSVWTQWSHFIDLIYGVIQPMKMNAGNVIISLCFSYDFVNHAIPVAKPVFGCLI